MKVCFNDPKEYSCERFAEIVNNPLPLLQLSVTYGN